MSKNLDETVRLYSEKRQEWIREIRGERLQGIAESASSAPRVASSSAASVPGRNECPGTHCSLIEKEERNTVPARSSKEFEVKGTMEEMTGWRGQNDSQIRGEEMRSGRIVGAAETSKERAEWRRLQQKNVSILGLLKRKEWNRCHRESNWQVRRSRPCHKEKEQSRQSRAPDCEHEISRGSKRKHERVSGRKALQEDLQSLGFTPSLAKPEIGKEIRKRRASS